MDMMFTFFPLLTILLFMAVPAIILVIVLVLVVNHKNRMDGQAGPSGSTGRRLYRSNRDKMLAGVCGGLAEYFDIDPTLVRIAWVFFTFLGGSGILLYIIALIVIPARPETM